MKIETLTKGRNVDLLILFADFMDIIRNVAIYADQSKSNLDAVLGPDTNWREKWQALPSHAAPKVSKLFLSIYQEQLRKHLGYSVFDDEVIRAPNGTRLYRLMYASKHELGLKFWRKSTERFRGGGRLF